MKPRIVAAAVKYSRKNGFGSFIVSVPAPQRHHNIFIACPLPAEEWERTQGFLTSEGTFVTRLMGLLVAIDAGQTTQEKLIGTVLTSEDLW